MLLVGACFDFRGVLPRWKMQMLLEGLEVRASVLVAARPNGLSIAKVSLCAPALPFVSRSGIHTDRGGVCVDMTVETRNL